MEHCFGITLGMLFLVGYLQAMPVPMSELPKKNLLEISCEHNATFISPTNTETHCHAAALRYFIQGLLQAQTKCKDTDGYINDTLEILDSVSEIQQSSSQCKWESRKEFKEFVNDLETLAQHLNSKHTTTVGVNN